MERMTRCSCRSFRLSQAGRWKQHDVADRDFVARLFSPIFCLAPASRDRTRVTVGVARIACFSPAKESKRGDAERQTLPRNTARSSDYPVVYSTAAGAQAILLCRCTVTVALSRMYTAPLLHCMLAPADMYVYYARTCHQYPCSSASHRLTHARTVYSDPETCRCRPVRYCTPLAQ